MPHYCDNCGDRRSTRSMPGKLNWAYEVALVCDECYNHPETVKLASSEREPVRNTPRHGSKTSLDTRTPNL